MAERYTNHLIKNREIKTPIKCADKLCGIGWSRCAQIYVGHKFDDGLPVTSYCCGVFGVELKNGYDKNTKQGGLLRCQNCLDSEIKR